MDSNTIEQWLEDLKSSDPNRREQATQNLWQTWFSQKGTWGLMRLRQAQSYLNQGDFSQAEAILTETLTAAPDFAEAWNRRAILYYTQQDYQKAKEDCQAVVALNPYHFGAWHGLGLCEAALENYREAIVAFKKALLLQPQDLSNQKLLLECTARL